VHTLAVVVRWPWLGVLASLLSDLIETMSRGRSFSRILELGLRTDQRWAVSRPQLSRMDFQIGSSDLRMPENIDGHAGSCFRRDLRRPIGLGRMQSAAIAVAFDRLFVVGTPMIRLMLGIVTSSKVPVLALGGTVNVFNPLAGAALAPGSIVEIYGANLASTTAQAASTPLPTALEGTSVTIGGIASPLYFVSPGQINAQVPWELRPGNQYQISIGAQGAVSTSDTIQVTAVSPGVAALLSGSAIATQCGWCSDHNGFACQAGRNGGSVLVRTRRDRPRNCNRRGLTRQSVGACAKHAGGERERSKCGGFLRENDAVQCRTASNQYSDSARFPQRGPVGCRLPGWRSGQCGYLVGAPIRIRRRRLQKIARAEFGVKR
jgi:hypothetical protein